MSVAIAMGIVFAVDPRFGGSSSLHLLDFFGHRDFQGPIFSGVIWAMSLVNGVLVLLAGPVVAARRMYADCMLLPIIASPLRLNLIIANRLVMSGVDLLRVGRLTILPLLWVVITGPARFEVAASGLALAVIALVLGMTLGFQAAFLMQWTAKRGRLGQILAPLLSFLPGLLALPLAWLGPAALNWRTVLISAALTVVTGMLTQALGRCYREGLPSYGILAKRRVSRRVRMLESRRGPVWATIMRDISLVASNPMTWFRLSALFALVGIYPLLGSRLEGVGHLLAPGLLGIPLAYTLGVSYLAISEIGVALGQVDCALGLTVAASPCPRRTATWAAFLSNVVVGVPACFVSGLLVLMLGRVSYGTVDAVVYVVALVAVAVGQAALGASTSRAGRDCSFDTRLEPAGWVGLLLEQVPMTPRGLKTLGLLALHLALCLSILSWASRLLGPTPAYAVFILAAVLPATIPALGLGKTTVVWRPGGSAESLPLSEAGYGSEPTRLNQDACE